jgi:hypothetical protein
MRLAGAFAGDVRVLDMLDDPMQWPDRAGLYCLMNTGDLTENHNRFRIQPYTNDNVLMLEPPDLAIQNREIQAKPDFHQLSILGKLDCHQLARR